MDEHGVLRDALASASRDEEDFRSPSKVHLILRRPRSGRLEGRTPSMQER